MGEEIDFLQFPKVARNRVSTKAARRIARRFDREFFDGSRENGYGGYVYDGRWQAVARRMAAHYGLTEGDKVLDIGCGKGFLVKDFKDLGIDAHGIDVSAYAIESAVTPNCYVGNAKDLMFVEGDFDLAVSINTIHNLKRDECAQALLEMMRVAEHQYVVLDAYRNKEEQTRMENWNLTALTMMSVPGWLRFFKRVGYTGDYYWFFA